MAQRTDPERLIAPRVKVTSAGVIPALVIAVALAVSGCGGDSAQEKTVSAPRSSAASAESERKEATSSKAPASKDGSASPQKATDSPGGGGGGERQSSGKEATRVTIPEGEPEPELTPAERTEVTVADISLESPGLGSEALPATYTCDGRDIWPALRWQGVPTGTAELALFAMNMQPVGGELFFDWAVVGLDPGLAGIEEGRLPKGAVLGRNSFGKNGYSICPKGSGETFIFALYALPRRLPAQKGFDPQALRDQALEISGNAGLLAVSYGRG